MKEYYGTIEDCCLWTKEVFENSEDLRAKRPDALWLVEVNELHKVERDLQCYKDTLYKTAKAEEAFKAHANKLAEGLDKLLNYIPNIQASGGEHHKTSAITMINNYLANHKAFMEEIR